MIALQLVFHSLSTQCVTGTNTVDPIPLMGTCDGCVFCQGYTVQEAFAQYMIRKPHIPMIPL